MNFAILVVTKGHGLALGNSVLRGASDPRSSKPVVADIFEAASIECHAPAERGIPWDLAEHPQALGLGILDQSLEDRPETRIDRLGVGFAALYDDVGVLDGIEIEPDAAQRHLALTEPAGLELSEVERALLPMAFCFQNVLFDLDVLFVGPDLLSLRGVLFEAGLPDRVRGAMPEENRLVDDHPHEFDFIDRLITACAVFHPPGEIGHDEPSADLRCRLDLMFGVVALEGSPHAFVHVEGRGAVLSVFGNQPGQNPIGELHSAYSASGGFEFGFSAGKQLGLPLVANIILFVGCRFALPFAGVVKEPHPNVGTVFSRVSGSHRDRVVCVARRSKRDIHGQAYTGKNEQERSYMNTDLKAEVVGSTPARCSKSLKNSDLQKRRSKSVANPRHLRRSRGRAKQEDPATDFDAWDDPLQRQLDRERAEEVAKLRRRRRIVANRPLSDEEVAAEFQRLREELAREDFRADSRHEKSASIEDSLPEDLDQDESEVERMLHECRKGLAEGAR